MHPRRHFQLLCVDDNARVLRMLKVLFTNAGYEVGTAPDGFAALEKVHRDPKHFQLIVTDLRMPGLDGFGLIERARRAGYIGRLIVYAATILPGDRQRLTALRVDRIMPKPARASELVAAVKEVQAGF